MRIAFIVHDYHRRGGHSRYVYELATRFAREHDVHVFANVVDEAPCGASPSPLAARDAAHRLDYANDCRQCTVAPTEAETP